MIFTAQYLAVVVDPSGCVVLFDVGYVFLKLLRLPKIMANEPSSADSARATTPSHQTPALRYET